MLVVHGTRNDLNGNSIFPTFGSDLFHDKGGVEHGWLHRDRFQTAHVAYDGEEYRPVSLCDWIFHAKTAYGLDHLPRLAA